MAYSFDTTVLEDVEVEITFTTTGYDNTDVGGGVNDVDEWYISHVYGDEITLSEIQDKLSDKDNEILLEECYAHLD